MTEQFKSAIRQMISISDREMAEFIAHCETKTFKAKEFLACQDAVSNEVFFINRGITRSLVIDKDGYEHTIHFSLENQFIADYASFLLKSPASNSIQALEETDVLIMSREMIDWGYNNLKQGERLGRIIAEYYFIYFDGRIKNMYFNSPTERYNSITKVFPGIYNRAPQHMIASYLGISPIHLSRLKKSDYKKV
jgi:hypothetical protein